MTIEDASVQAALQPWVEMECYQLGRGARLGHIDCVDLGGQRLVRERQEVAVQKLGATPSDVCIVSCCTPDPTFRFSELSTDAADAIFLMPEHVEFDIYVPAGAQTSYVAFSQEAFLQGARALDPARWERTPRHLLSIPTSRRGELATLVALWLQASGTRTALPDGLLLQNILRLMTTTRQDHDRPSAADRSRAFHVCRMARAFVEQRLADDALPTIVDICARLGVSERSLQYAFRAYVDMTPVAYLRMCRLNRARAVLRASDPRVTAVTAVALRFGFLHLGRFSHDYRRQFGELPSRTLNAPAGSPETKSPSTSPSRGS